MHIKLDLKIFFFIIIFLLMKKIEIYGMLMLFGLIHEIGHLLCGITLGFKPDNIKILPYGFKLLFKTNYKDYNKKIKRGTMLSLKRIITYSAGPITNIIIAIIIGIVNFKQGGINYYTKTEIIYSNLLIAAFNLIPIYPMDGGKILHEIIHIFAGLRKSYQLTKEITWISLAILTALAGIIVLYYNSFIIIMVIGYVWIIALKTQKEMSLKEKIFERIKKYEEH